VALGQPLVLLWEPLDQGQLPLLLPLVLAVACCLHLTLEQKLNRNSASGPASPDLGEIQPPKNGKK